MEISRILMVTGLLLFLGIFSSKLSSRFNVPILLMFLGVGMICGSDGFGLIMIDCSSPANNSAINFLGTVAMSFILFSGGLDTQFKSIRKMLIPGGILATFGVLLTAVVVGVGAMLFLQKDWKWCLLFGAIISSTDAAAVFAVLRSRGVSLKGELRPLLELESGSNDPMAAFLTIFMLSVFSGKIGSVWWFLPSLVLKMGIGIGAGYALGRLGSLVFNRVKLEYEGLYLVCGFAIVISAFGIAECLYGNGFMSVYVCGLVMGNRKFNYQKGLAHFSDGMSWLMQVVLFTALGLLVNPRELMSFSVWGSGLLLSLVLMLAARPVAVFLCLIGQPFTTREKTLISWVGLRGAAPIVLATFPLVNEVWDAQLMFNLVFFIVLSSVLLQGRTLMPAARLLKLDEPVSDKSRAPLELEFTDSTNGLLHEFEVSKNSSVAGKKLKDLDLPSNVLVTLIRRNERFIVARGNTAIHVGDGMLLMGEPEQLKEAALRFFPDEDVNF